MHPGGAGLSTTFLVCRVFTPWGQPSSPSCPHPVPLVASSPLQFSSLSGPVKSSLWCKEGTLFVGSPF